jgi:transcriptional regulator with GAF, ATPase, and Fis domain
LVSIGVEQIIIIPLMAKGRLVGSLSLSTNATRVYAPEQIALLKTIGQQIGVAVENARLYEQAERSAQDAERSRLARELHVSPDKKIHTFLYATQEQKGKLIGASGTDFAKPWLSQLHINLSDVDVALKHELVHILAGDFGFTPLRIGRIPDSSKDSL